VNHVNKNWEFYRSFGIGMFDDGTSESVDIKVNIVDTRIQRR
jgi:hypothetical protein